MYLQLALEAMHKKLKNEGRPPNFQEVWSEEVHHVKDSKIENLDV
jgi:hypothetical protein